MAPLWAVATCNDEVLPEATDPESRIRYVEISDVDEVRGIIGTTDVSFGYAPSRARRKVREGDVILSTVRTYLRAVAAVDSDHAGLVVSTGFAVIRPRKLHAGYLKHVVSSGLFIEEVISRSVGVSYPAINATEVMKLKIPVPPLQEQCRIAAFLDYETARIDELVHEQERLLQLLVEERASIVSRAIFDGNESSAKARLGYFVDLLSGFAFPSERFSHDSTEIKLLRGANVGVGAVRWDDVVFWRSDQLVGLERFLLEEGDTVLGMDRPWISSGTRVAEVRSSDLPALLVQRVARMRARNGLSQRFLRFVLESIEFQASIEADLTGVSVPHISSEQILSFRIPIFSLAEQERRAATAEARLLALESTSREVAAMIALLQERRSALIGAAVTGQLVLCDWRPSEPEAVAEVT